MICAGSVATCCRADVSGMCGAGSGARTTIGDVVVGGSFAIADWKFVDDIFRSAGVNSLFGGSALGRRFAIIDF